MRQRTRLPGRRGFTLIELMVAMALMIFIMYIIAEAFSAGSQVFRRLKAIGDMNARLRSATTTLRRLLAADHFEGKKRLSDPAFWDGGPPQQGFFRIWQDAVDPPTKPPPPDPEITNFPEGEDLDGLASYRSTRHHLHFTTRLRGNHRGEFFHATLPAGSPLFPGFANWPGGFPRPDSRMQDTNNIYSTPWAEIALYLKPSLVANAAGATQEMTEDSTATAGTPLPLYTLYLRQRVLRPLQPIDSGDIPLEIPVPAAPLVTTQPTRYHELSVTRGGYDGAATAPTPVAWGPDDRDTYPNRGNNGNQFYVNTPADVTMPIRRFGWPYWATFPNAPAAPNADVPDLAGNRSPGGLPSVTYTTPAPPLTIPALPGYPTLIDESADLAGTDVLLTDVISMDVRVLLDDAAYALTVTNTNPMTPPVTVQGMPYFISLHNELYPTTIYNDLRAKWPTGAGWNPAVAPTTNTIIQDKYKMDRGALGQPPLTVGAPSLRPARVFDTWSNRKDAKYDYSKWDQTQQPETIPMYTIDGSKYSPIRIRAIQITLRIWDSKTKQSRQVSFVQDT